MAQASEGVLAETLAALLRERRVSVAHVARVAGFARSTVAYILDGTTMRPPPSTLGRLALGVATDPGTGELDHDFMKKAERLLAVGAGYADPEARDVETLLELAFFYNLNSRERTRAWVATFERYRDLDADAVRGLRSLPDDATRRDPGR